MKLTVWIDICVDNVQVCFRSDSTVSGCKDRENYKSREDFESHG
jgi:hypothetical protein